MTMTQEQGNGWNPNWALHPGEHLDEHLEVRGWSQAEFARIAGLTKKHVSDIVNGKNPVTAATAIKLEHVLGMKAHIWTGLQADWDLFQERHGDDELSEEEEEWIARQPIRELKQCGVIEPDSDDIETLNSLLGFFRIGTAASYGARVASVHVNHREGKGRGEVLPEYVFAWLMMGEWKARSMNLPAYNRDKFEAAVLAIRELTTEGPKTFQPEMERLCAEAGVALVFQPAFKKTKLFGSARWIDGKKPVIQMSLRMKFNDHFWWTFFHECGHILLHAGQDFADDQHADPDELETEANDFAEDALVGRKKLRQILAEEPQSKIRVKAIARALGIHPGILVGMLQHHGVLEFRFMNDLKAKYEFTG